MKNNEMAMQIKTCAVWLCLDKADYTRIKLWAGILGCSEQYMKKTIANVQYHINNKTGTENNDAFLIVVYNGMKDLPIENVKNVFMEIRKGGENVEKTDAMD